MDDNVLKEEKFPFGLVVIAVIMVFTAIATDYYWIASWAGKDFPSLRDMDPEFYANFALPDMVLSILLYIGAFGLIKLKKYGFMAALLAMGMWLYDLLLVFMATLWTHINIVSPSLLFVLFTVFYLRWKREIFT
jgi:hypothetical protein